MSVIHLTCLLFLLAAPTYCTNTDSEQKRGDFYASITSLEHLLVLEQHLLHNLKNFLNRELDKHQQMNLILEHFDKENKKALNDPQEYFNSPINVLRTIKSSVVDFKDLEGKLFERSIPVDYEFHLNQIATTLGLPWPHSDDLKGAVFGLERLQNTYKLNATDLVEGRILGVQVSSPMSTRDAFTMGKGLLEAGRFQRSFEWFSVAWAKVNDQSAGELTILDEVTILEGFSFAAYKTGKLQTAMDLTNQLLWFDPRNIDAKVNLKILQKDIFDERNARKPRSNVKVVKPPIPQVYEATCRGELKQSPTELRPLRCMYVNNNVPFLRIAPFKMEQLSLEPSVVYFHESVYESEIERILEEANPYLYRSEIGEKKQRQVSTYRTCMNTWLEYHEYDFLANIKQRLVDMTQLTMDSGEVLQVVNYGIGGHYGSHFDFSTKPHEEYDEWKGNRIATAMIYLSDVELGGATAFPILKLAVKPIKGSVVFWYNLHNSTEPDFRMIHAACPVLKGSKWVLNEWIHADGQEFRRPCGLQSYAYLSKEYEVQ